MVIYATEYEKRLIVQALRDYARNCPGGTQDQAATLAHCIIKNIYQEE